MLDRLRRRTWAGRALALLALVALSLKLLSPPGFMPGRSAAAPVVLCSGHVLAADDGAGKADGAPHRAGDHPCPFAGGALPPVLAAVPALQAMPAAHPPVAAPRLALAPGRGMAAPPPPSHAPPSVPA